MIAMQVGMMAVLQCAAMAQGPGEADSGAALRKVKDIVVYEDARFYSAFPSVVVRPSGEVLVAFRRAPDRGVFGEKGHSHTDPNSYLVFVRSQDNGETWAGSPELILAHPFGGSQDPCMMQLRDGTLMCASYGWALVREGADDRASASLHHGDFVFIGGYLMRSENGGASWEGPMIPPPVPGVGDPECVWRAVPGV